MEILQIHYRAPLDSGDQNCHNFEFTAPKHGACAWNPQQIISYSDITEEFGLSFWTCPSCDLIFEVYIPIDSDMEEQEDLQLFISQDTLQLR